MTISSRLSPTEKGEQRKKMPGGDDVARAAVDGGAKNGVQC